MYVVNLYDTDSGAVILRETLVNVDGLEHILSRFIGLRGKEAVNFLNKAYEGKSMLHTGVMFNTDDSQYTITALRKDKAQEFGPTSKGYSHG